MTFITSLMNGKRWLLGISLVVAVFLTLGVSALSQNQNRPTAASSQPKISWSERQISVTLPPGGSATTTVTLTSSVAITNITLRPVPEIARFLAAQPNSFATVPAYQAQSVRLSFSIPAGTAQRIYEGTVHVRDGNRTLPDTLKIVINVSLQALPPDPGAAGRITLEGIDSDRDGVRDDVQRWIFFKYSNSEKARTALRQVAVDFQDTLITTSDKARSIEASRKLLRSRECAYYALGAYIPGASESVFDQAKLVLDQLRSIVLNTKLRSDMYMLSDKHFSGQVYRLLPIGGKKDACRFNVDGLPN